MATGFQVFNDNGIIQIDEFHKNMVLVARGTATTSRPGGAGIDPYYGANYFQLSYPVAQRQPVLALRCSSNSNGVTFVTFDDRFTIFSNGVATFEYFIYDRIEFGNAAGNTGLQVFNEQGVEVFNSNNNYMKILDSYNVNITLTPQDDFYPKYHQGSTMLGKRIAVAMGVQSTGQWVVETGGGGQIGSPGPIIIRWFQSQVATFADNTYQIGNSAINIVNGVSGGQPRQYGAVGSYNSGLILDVTGL